MLDVLANERPSARAKSSRGQSLLQHQPTIQFEMWASRAAPVRLLRYTVVRLSLAAGLLIQQDAKTRAIEVDRAGARDPNPKRIEVCHGDVPEGTE
eukprot:704769-Amphidinium_carterae.2